MHNAEIDDLKVLAYGDACVWEAMRVGTNVFGCA